MICRAHLLSVAIAAATGVVAEDPIVCEDDATHQVVIPVVRGLEFAADVCAAHEQLVDLTTAGVRSIRKHVRT